MNGYECVRCGCGFHLSSHPTGEPIPCADHGCATYYPAFAWTPDSIERNIIAEAVHALRKGKPAAEALRILERAA